MTALRTAALALGALLAVATASAGGLRIVEWSIDARAGLDETARHARLAEVLADAGPGAVAMTALPLHVRVRIVAVADAEVPELSIRSTDLDAGRSVRSTVRAARGTTEEVVAAALVADLGYLQAARGGFPAPPGTPPELTDLLDGVAVATLIGTVHRATGQSGEATVGGEMLDVAAHSGGVSMLLGGAAIDLGPRFELTAATATSLLAAPARAPGMAPPHEIARTRWTYDTLTLEPGRARILRRRSGDDSVSVLDLPGGGRRLDALPHGGLAALTAYGPAYLRLTEREIELHPVPAAARFITAMDTDRHRRLLLYDAYDRRVVIVGLDGREVGSVRPQVDPRLLPFPHALAVQADGSILLGGAGTVWAFDRTGRARWLLARSRGGRELLPPQFLLEPAPDGTAFYLLDGPRARVLRFDEARAAAPTTAGLADATAAATGPAVRLAAVALAEAVAARDWGNLSQAAELAHLAAELYAHALADAPEDSELRAGRARAVEVRADAESVLFQEHFLTLAPDRLVLAAAAPGTPQRIAIEVANDGAVARTGVRLLAAGIDLPIGSIEPGQRVTRLVTLRLPDSMTATRESIAMELGVVISAEEPGRGQPRRMFVTLPLRVPAPRWDPETDGGSARPR